MAALEAELRDMVRGLRHVKAENTVAIDMANKEIATKEAELVSARGRLTNAADELGTAVDELRQIESDLGEAEAALDGDDTRRMSQAVKRIVGRIECHFRRTGKKCPASELAEVVIYPKENGQPARYPHDPSLRARNCTSSVPWGSCWITGKSAAARWTTGRACGSGCTTISMRS